MNKDFSKVWNYLTHEQVSALDVLILTIVGSFFTWILASIGRLLGRMLLSGLASLRKFIRRTLRKLHSKYVKKQPTLTEYLILKDKVDKGQKLKWYEQRKYDNAKDSLANRISKQKLSEDLAKKLMGSDKK